MCCFSGVATTDFSIFTVLFVLNERRWLVRGAAAAAAAGHFTSRARHAKPAHFPHVLTLRGDVHALHLSLSLSRARALLL